MLAVHGTPIPDIPKKDEWKHTVQFSWEALHTLNVVKNVSWKYDQPQTYKAKDQVGPSVFVPLLCSARLSLGKLPDSLAISPFNLTL